MALTRDAASTAERSRVSTRRGFVWSQAVIVAVVSGAMFVGLSAFLPGFLSPSNLINLVRNVAVLGMLGVGMATVVIGRGIDLSMIPIMAASVAFLFVLVADGVATPMAGAAAAGAAALCGAANGALIAYVEIPAFSPRWRSALWHWASGNISYSALMRFPRLRGSAGCPNSAEG
jgi:ribose transport system permease protein